MSCRRYTPYPWILAVAMMAAGCSSGSKSPAIDPGDREMLATASAGEQAFMRGAYDQAVEQYRRSLARARLQDDAALIGDQAYNLSICYLALGDLAPAHDRLAEAEAALRRAGSPLADVLLVQARLAYRKADGVEEAALRVLDDPQAHPTNLHRAQVAILRAEFACGQGNIPAVAELLAQAQTLSIGLPATDVGAGLARVAGRLHLLRGEAMAAGESFDLEVRLQRQNHRYPDVSKALMQAGEAYTKAAKPTLAADRFYRAAASFTAQEKSAIALQALNYARLAATQAGDVPLTHLIDDLNAEIKMLPATQPAVR